MPVNSGPPENALADPSLRRQGHNHAIDDALAEARQSYVARNTFSGALFERAQDVMPGGNTRSALHFDPFPLYMASSAGAFVEDVDGHRYLDVLGEFTAGLYGHNDPLIREAVTQTLEGGISNGAPGEAEIELAALMRQRFPSLERIRFCNSGTEANLYALTLARAATGRTNLVCFRGAYHGGVFVFADGGSAMNAPFDWTVCRYNDAEEASHVIDQLGPSLAAVIVEPMLSNGGCIPATTEFLQVLRERTAAHGAILIFDEVVTSRMGAGGLQGLYGICPDLTTFGKYLGGGFSFGAFGGRADLLDHMNPMRPNALPHAGTFNNNLFSMRAGVVGLEKIYAAERAEAFLRTGERLRSRLNELAAPHGLGVQFTGVGSAMNIHFHNGEIRCPEDIAVEPQQLFQLFHFDLMENGIYAARRGQINLSLPMGDKEFDTIVLAVQAFLERRSPLLSNVGVNGQSQ
ncbi:glutamate-1-semialdehyde 2,1-aminomutase [Labrys miyagiensis]|uniref:Glutamate-1-semialdehyde 2,1-aminomutase n=1 Tax=Labrys miyagiensis TaxID=346912 RepID=A0ABQ6CQ39_9HYPH|nr:aminotransferase class III-fold pyridoxal phosphate-dependent enzyme [Labrys miyagiensis]GLS22250.1 glutamate-1-semialdehyde 2,1-aminomutase [Labrys miyagiensis]